MFGSHIPVPQKYFGPSGSKVLFSRADCFVRVTQQYNPITQFGQLDRCLWRRGATAIDSYNAAELSCGIMVDDDFVDHDASTGDTCDFTGVMTYSYDWYRILPRDEGDVSCVH